MAAWQFAAATPPCRTKKSNASFVWHGGSTRPSIRVALQQSRGPCGVIYLNDLCAIVSACVWKLFALAIPIIDSC